MSFEDIVIEKGEVLGLFVIKTDKTFTAQNKASTNTRKTRKYSRRRRQKGSFLNRYEFSYTFPKFLLVETG